jgi:hypothetical protein
MDEVVNRLNRYSARAKATILAIPIALVLSAVIPSSTCFQWLAASILFCAVALWPICFLVYVRSEDKWNPHAALKGVELLMRNQGRGFRNNPIADNAYFSVKRTQSKPMSRYATSATATAPANKSLFLRVTVTIVPSFEQNVMKAKD